MTNIMLQAYPSRPYPSGPVRAAIMKPPSFFACLLLVKKRKQGQGAQERAEDAGGLTPVKDGNAGPALPGPLNVSHDFWVPL